MHEAADTKPFLASCNRWVLMRILGTFGQTVFLTLGGLVKLKFDLKKKDGTARRVNDF